MATPSTITTDENAVLTFLSSIPQERRFRYRMDAEPGNEYTQHIRDVMAHSGRTVKAAALLLCDDQAAIQTLSLDETTLQEAKELAQFFEDTAKPAIGTHTGVVTSSTKSVRGK